MPRPASLRSIGQRVALATGVCALLVGCADVTAPDATPSSDAPRSTTTEPSSDAPRPTTTEPAAGSTHAILVPDATTHLGATWFSPPEPAAAGVIEQRWVEVQQASSVGRVMFDWIDVEPEQGDYRFDELDEALGELVDGGLSPMVTIAATDVSGTEFPDWLGGFDPETAANAYVAMLDAALEMLREHGVWTLAIANEPPLAGEELDLDDFATFVAAVEERAEVLAPDLPITFTFAGADPFIDSPAIDRMIDAVDVFSVNHYCIEADLLRRPLSEATERIDRLVERAGDLPIVFQEFGCPAGEANGSSDTDQLAWFEVALDHVDSIEQVRAAFVFEFLDWSASTFELDFGADLEGLRDELGPEFVERFESWLLTSGLVRSDGSTRPAFDAFLEASAT